MSVSRYWRAVAFIQNNSKSLELSSIQLYTPSLTRVDMLATISCTFTPSVGSISNLADDNDLSTCLWYDSTQPQFAIIWDFNTNPQDICALLLGSGASQDTFPTNYILQSSSDGYTWNTTVSASDQMWFGSYTTQPLTTLTNHDPVLHLPLTGNNWSTSIVDTSRNPKSITCWGQATISTAAGKFAGSSLYLNGLGSYISSPPHNDFIFGIGDFTISMHIKTTCLGAKYLVDRRPITASPCWYIYIDSGKITWNSTNYGAAFIQGLTNVNDNVWHHIAVCRSSGYLRLFVDGVLQGGTVCGGDFTLDIPLVVGGKVIDRITGYDYDGYISDLYIVKGYGLYKTNFTPPQVPFGDIVAPTPKVQILPYVFDYNHVGDASLFTTVTTPLEDTTLLTGKILEINSILNTKEIKILGAPPPESTMNMSDVDFLAISKLPDIQPTTTNDKVKILGTPPPVFNSCVLSNNVIMDQEDFGNYKIEGVIGIYTPLSVQPLMRRVQLYSQKHNRLVRETWSDPLTGAYSFTNIKGYPNITYFVVAFDHLTNKNAVIRDNVTPELM